MRFLFLALLIGCSPSQVPLENTEIPPKYKSYDLNLLETTSIQIPGNFFCAAENQVDKLVFNFYWSNIFYSAYLADSCSISFPKRDRETYFVIKTQYPLEVKVEDRFCLDECKFEFLTNEEKKLRIDVLSPKEGSQFTGSVEIRDIIEKDAEYK